MRFNDKSYVMFVCRNSWIPHVELKEPSMAKVLIKLVEVETWSSLNVCSFKPVAQKRLSDMH